MASSESNGQQPVAAALYVTVGGACRHTAGLAITGHDGTHMARVLIRAVRNRGIRPKIKIRNPLTEAARAYLDRMDRVAAAIGPLIIRKASTRLLAVAVAGAGTGIPVRVFWQGIEGAAGLEWVRAYEREKRRLGRMLTEAEGYSLLAQYGGCGEIVDAGKTTAMAVESALPAAVWGHDD